jgi:hypothetical protein
LNGFPFFSDDLDVAEPDVPSRGFRSDFRFRPRDVTLSGIRNSALDFALDDLVLLL